MTKDTGYVERDTRILLADGTSEKIFNVVNSSTPKEVLGVRDGKVVPSKVINVSNAGFKDAWLQLRYDLGHVTISRVSHVGRPGRILVATPDKEVCTNHELTQIVNLREGIELATLDYTPNNDYLFLLDCLLIGDASLSILSVDSGSAKLSCSHKQEHYEYLMYKKQLLKNLQITEDSYTSGYGTQMSRIYTRFVRSLSNYRSRWYSISGRIVPPDLGWLGDFGMAIWLMDDGALSHSDLQKDRLVFSTYRYMDTDIERLATHISNTYGVSAVASRTAKGTTLRINAGKTNEIQNLWSRIAPYVHPRMRYKVPSAFRDVEFIDMSVTLNADLDASLATCTLKTIEKYKKSKTVAYNIQTETGNYFANGILINS